MADRHTLEELNNCSREELITIVLMMQGQLDTLNENIERLIEQVRIANSYRFGKHTETLDSIDGQMSFFDEAESCCDLSVPEPAAEEVLPSRRNHKKKGQRETDLKDFPEEILPPYQVSTEELDAFYGAGNWRRMKDETYKRLRHEPESWTVEIHTVEVYVGTGGDHQDEFLRGKRPKDLLRGDGSTAFPQKPDGHINVKVEFGEGEGKVPLDNIAKRAETYKPKERVTYKMIKEYIEAKYGFKVHTAYIAEVKRDLGLPMYDAPNAVEELKQPRKHPTPEKVEAIKDALKHFEVI